MGKVTVYAADGMGSPVVATERGTIVAARANVIYCVCVLERSDLSYIGTHKAEGQWKCTQLRQLREN